MIEEHRRSIETSIQISVSKLYVKPVRLLNSMKRADVCYFSLFFREKRRKVFLSLQRIEIKEIKKADIITLYHVETEP